jgi:hypothetical protein
MVFDLSFSKVDTFHMSLDLCRFYLGDYVMSFIFLDLCLVDGCCLESQFLSTLRWRKTPCALMKHKMRQLLEEQKDFAVIIFSLVSICFQD